MKIKIKILNILLVLFLIQACGYKPIYSSSDLQINLEKYEYEKNNLNSQIIKSLKLFSNKDGTKRYDVKLDTKKDKRIISKNSKGEAQIFELRIKLEINVYNDNKNNTKTLSNAIRYNNNENKFELKQYEREIQKQIIDDLIEDILIFLSDI